MRHLCSANETNVRGSTSLTNDNIILTICSNRLSVKLLAFRCLAIKLIQLEIQKTHVSELFLWVWTVEALSLPFSSSLSSSIKMIGESGPVRSTTSTSLNESSPSTPRIPLMSPAAAAAAVLASSVWFGGTLFIFLSVSAISFFFLSKIFTSEKQFLHILVDLSVGSTCKYNQISMLSVE